MTDTRDDAAGAKKNKAATGFDAFFENISKTKEFETSFIHNADRLGIKKSAQGADFAGSLRDIELEMKQSEAILWALETSLGMSWLSSLQWGNIGQWSNILPAAVESGNQTEESESKTHSQKPASTEKQTGTETNTPPTVEIERFTLKNPKTHGFLGIAGMTDLKTELMESFIRPLKFYFWLLTLRAKKESDWLNEKELEKLAVYESLYESYTAYQVSIPTGLLFYWPPGTGKTYIAKKLAEELGAGFIAKSMGEFGSSFVHQTSKNVHDFFEAAKAASHGEPVILFLDEIDSLVSKRTGNVDAQKAEEVSQFLQEFNKLESAPNLVVVAATNRPDHLDSAILRSGRLDKKFYIGPPDILARKELFMIHIEKKWRPHTKLDYEALAQLTDGYVASDIEAICDEVARDASKSILDAAMKLTMDEEFSNWEGNPKRDGEAATKKKKPQGITMELLKKAILDTPTSLKMEDVLLFEAWKNGL